MDRRTFLTTAAAGAAVLTARADEPPKPEKKPRMKVGHQGHSSDADLKVLAALGVQHICSALPSRKLDDAWSVDSLSKLRDRVEKAGAHLDMVPLPMSSSLVTGAENPNILLGKSPERDREIDDICTTIRSAGKVGIPAVKYNFTLLGVLRTGTAPGRGGAAYKSFDFDKLKDAPPLDGAPANDEEMWDRITYFLKRVVPVAEESKVRLCCHPHDPALPPGKSYRGVHRVLGSVEGLKRFIETAPSPYHGLNFCQGTVAEMLDDPGKEIYDVISQFCKTGKVFNVHFRNIRGGRGKFEETFPDDGDVDMLRALRVYKEAGYDGMVMPDHAPGIDGDTGAAQAFDFAFGYIQGLIQTVYSEG
ncbi:MAG TPA: mannonate dehydratase [Gemmataceae bacterium]|nr:mannonate dehydratase [Gemmataceae bacterium]